MILRLAVGSPTGVCWPRGCLGKPSGAAERGLIFSFGDYELDEERFELRRQGRPVEVQPKALELLLHLVRNRERAVSKQELLKAIWPAVSVTQGSLARAVSLARAAVGDRSADPRTIGTVARRGYRFEAPVREAKGRPTTPNPGADGRADPASRYIGRAGLIARLEARLDSALAGAGCILFLAGEAGIGKTRTAELLAERARQAGTRVAVAWGLDEGAPAHWGWTRVLRALAASAASSLALLSADRRAALARLAPDLVPDREAAPATVRSDEAERFALFDAVQVFLNEVARAGPLALFLDDLHSADAESIGLLEFVGQTIAAVPIAILVTCREDDAGRTPRQARALERLLRLTALERWPLTGLDADEVREFVRARLGRDSGPELSDALARQTGGNPLLMGESLRSLEARGLLGAAREGRAWEALLPRSIRHLLLPKLRRLSAGASAALGCAAAVGGEIDPGLLADCLLDASQLDDWLAESLAAGLIAPAAASGRGPRFAHALVRESLYAELVPEGDERRAVHARIFAALGQRATASGEALPERAHHACEAVPRVPAGRAIELARLAGEQAARRLDFERAVAWCERALACLGFLESDDPALRAALLLGLGDAQTRTVGIERARASYREAADHARSLGRSDLLVAAALGFAHRPNSSGSGDAEAIRLLEEAQREARGGEEAVRIRLLSRLAVELRYADRRRAEALMEEAIGAARGLGDAEVLARALDDSSFVRWSPADSEGWVALNAEIVRVARACGDLELVFAGQRGVVTGLLELGDLAGVERELRACARTADTLRTPHARWLCAAFGAMRGLLYGDLGAAETHVGEALALGDRLDAREVALELGIQLAYLRVEQGRAAEIEPVVRAQVQRFSETAAWRAALARILVAAGREAEARNELERVARQRFAAVPRDRGWLPALAFAAEVAFVCGDERAASYLEPLLAPHARLHVVAGGGLLYYGAVAHPLGLVAATRSRWDAAIAHFEAALAAEEAAGARLWAAHTRIAYARALLARGASLDRPRAAKLVGDALDAARQQGWAGLVATARDLEAALWTRRVASAPPPHSRSRRSES
jgi:DNA-binding winged helix-turn-helix (wHTH) protein/tetratricopeptide (TPR) repeat protein